MGGLDPPIAFSGTSNQLPQFCPCGMIFPKNKNREDQMSRVAVVTGGSRGIGAAISKELKAKGCKVAAIYAGNDAAASAFTAETGIKTYKCDVTSAETCAATLKQIEADLGPIDILVNNAGITRDAMFHKMTLTQWQEVLNTNLNALFNMTSPIWGGMRDRSFGRIVCISSINGQKGQMGQVNYSAAKAGMQGFTKTLAIELGQFGITANAVAPGFIVTDMTAATAARLGMSFEDFQAAAAPQIPVRRVGQVDDVAHVISFLCSEGAGFVSGQVIYVAGGPLC